MKCICVHRGKVWVKSIIISVNSYVWSQWGSCMADPFLLQWCDINFQKQCSSPLLSLYTHTHTTISFYAVVFTSSPVFSLVPPPNFYFVSVAIIAVINYRVTKECLLCNISHRTKRQMFLAPLVLELWCSTLYFSLNNK